MKPIELKEQTTVLRRPIGMADKQCGNLPVYSDGKYCISCWQMSLVERLKVLIFGKVWIWVHSGKTHPPIALQCYKSAFEKLRKQKS